MCQLRMGAGIDLGMALKPFPSSILDENKIRTTFESWVDPLGRTVRATCSVLQLYLVWTLLYLVFLVVLSVEHHRFEPVAPEDLVRYIRSSSLERQTRRFDRSLHRHVDLEVGARQVGGAHPDEKFQFKKKMNFCHKFEVRNGTLFTIYQFTGLKASNINCRDIDRKCRNFCWQIWEL